MGHIYAAPYAILEPGLSLVAEDDEGVAGFVVGTRDTASWETRLEQDWWPSLRRRYADPDKTEIAGWTHDQRRIFMIHHPTPTPIAVVQSYPAHLHMNLLPRLQGQGMGLRMFETWLAVARARGIEAMHVGVNRSNARALHFWLKLGFAELAFDGAAEGRTTWMGRRVNGSLAA